MKNFIILSILVLVLSVSAAAQYDTVSILPQTMDVVVDYEGDCFTVCMGECDNTRYDCKSACDKKCSQKEMPPIIQPRDCIFDCRDYYAKCQQLKTGDCESDFVACQNKCIPHPLPPRPEDCLTKCKRAAGSNGVFNPGTYVECVINRCKQDCKEACSTAYGDDAQNCVLKMCTPGEEQCDAPCLKRLEDCQTQPAMTAAMPDCKRMYAQCYEQLCGPKEPQSCEGRCEMMRDDCKANNIDPKSCQMKIDDCKRACKPCPPAGGCEMDCSKEYYGCTRKATSISSPEEQQNMFATCTKMVGGCLDRCSGPMPQGDRCEDKCLAGERECMSAGNSKEVCGPRTEDCMRSCRPVPPSGKCEDVCAQIREDCAAAGVDEASCKLKIDACMTRCKPKAQPPGCREVCVRKSEACLKEGGDRDKCINERSACLRDCGVSEGSAAMTAPEPSRRGFFARLWASMVG